ncbi:MAG: hypothetical protein EPO23_11560 [Xanthobacteraceae bacterium]|nr:MAG: hypothetical protein EPO23_11560 [Xanthobacteraceae bacterium]
MNICGVLVHSKPDCVADVAAALARISGVELHGSADGGRLIVTIEDTASTLALSGLEQIHRTPGVVAAALVYHHFEPDHDTAGAVAKEA